MGPNISATTQMNLENSGVPRFNQVWKHEQGISKSKKTESIRDQQSQGDGKRTITEIGTAAQPL